MHPIRLSQRRLREVPRLDGRVLSRSGSRYHLLTLNTPSGTRNSYTQHEQHALPVLQLVLALHASPSTRHTAALHREQHEQHTLPDFLFVVLGVRCPSRAELAAAELHDILRSSGLLVAGVTRCAA